MTARDFALLELDAKRLPGWPAREVRGPLPRPPQDPRDRGLAEQIIAGVVKNLLHLQYLIAHYSGRSLKDVDRLVQKILAVGLYQLRFLDRIPPSAAVDQAVDQAKRFGRAKAAGFVNAVLRNVGRKPEPEIPSPEDDAERYAELALSHPPALFRRLRESLDPAAALEFCRHDNREPPTIVRLFDGVDPAALRAEGVSILPHEQPGLYVVSPAKQPLLADWAKRGLAQVQDATAADVVRHLDVHPGQRVLDRCAGLGTKTLQIRQRAGEDGLVVAIDPAPARCEALRRLLAGRGIDNVAVVEAATVPKSSPALPTRYDRILVDAPCSNSGVLARRPEARYAQDDAALASLAKLQQEIMDDTAPWLAPGGLLVYSTCSVWPAENGGVVSRFLAHHADYERLDEAATWPRSDSPTAYRDGGYWALLRRKTSPPGSS